jgi:protocatechuate 3,4-dioxygenase beta subunit
MENMTPDLPPSRAPRPFLLDRRTVLSGGVGIAVASILAACSRGGDSGETAGGQAASTTPRSEQTTATTAAPTATSLTPTPECRDADDVTPTQTEGPYFKPSSPEKANLYADVNSGTRLLLTGSVLTTSCQPVGRALVDVWQADASGQYDNQTYRLRGHVFTDSQGRYRLDTILPGLYPGRTRHIHVKVQAPNGPILTTQLYFPGEAANARDGIYRQECEIDIRDVANGKEGNFNFVVRT